MIVDLSVDRFGEVYEIMLNSFPSSELRTKKGQRDLWSNSCYHINAYLEKGRILAFIAYWDLQNCRFVEHLATTPQCRGKGIGADLLKWCIEGTKAPLFLEIEPITEKDLMTQRRAAFYERLGFVVNHFPYEQLPLKEGDLICPLLIMCYKQSIETEDFEQYKKQIYETVYGNRWLNRGNL